MPGRTVSIAIPRVLLAVLPLFAASVNIAAPTEILDVVDELVAGINVAEYDVPDPLNALNDPLETVMSPTTKLPDDSDSVNVSVSVCPAFIVPAPARVMVTVGTTVS